jgi:2'-5' RNA ligase
VVGPALAGFAPHHKLLRKPRDAPPEFIPPLRWWVREFLLIDSVHGEGRHEVLGRWTLGG